MVINAGWILSWINSAILIQAGPQRNLSCLYCCYLLCIWQIFSNILFYYFGQITTPPQLIYLILHSDDSVISIFVEKPLVSEIFILEQNRNILRTVHALHRSGSHLWLRYRPVPLLLFLILGFTQEGNISLWHTPAVF